MNTSPTNAPLTGEDVHLLKKALIARQLRKEISALLDTPESIGALVPPPSPETPDATFPLLSPLFSRLLLPFPPLQAADNGPKEFWRVCGRFLGLFRGVDSGGTASHIAKRDLLANKAVDAIAAMLGKSVRTTTEEYELKEGTRVGNGVQVPEQKQFVFQEVEIVETKVTVKKGLWRSSETVEYTVRSIMNGRTAIARRDYGAFKSLHKELIRRANLRIPALPTVSGTPKGTSLSYAITSLTTYLWSLSSQPTSTLRDFLNQSEPIVHSNSDDQEASKKADEIRKALDMFRDEVLEPGGLAKVFAVIGKAEEISELPAHYRMVVEWWKMCAAASFYRTFITHDRAPEHLRRLKAFHSRAPYRSWAALLKSTNPVMVVKAIGNLLLARPFGTKCLLQSMITGIIDDEIRATLKEIQYVERFTGPDISISAKEVVNRAPLGGYELDISADLPAQILGYQPDAASPERQAVERLLGYYWRMRRLHQFRNLVQEDVVVHLAKDILAISYKPLTEAYKAADPGSCIRDGAKFIEDLLRIAEIEQAKGPTAPRNANAPPLRPFITLLSRHEHRIFKHVRSTLSAQPGRIHSLAEIASWADDVAKFFRGYGPVVDLASVVQNPSIDREALMRDLEKLRARKKERNEKVRQRVLSRVLGVAKGDVLDEELQVSDVGLALQDIWAEEHGPVWVDGLTGVADGVADSVADDRNTLQVPKPLHKARSITSFESLVDPSDAPSETPTPPTTEEDVESQLRALMVDDESGDSSDGTFMMEPPTVEPGIVAAASGFGVVYRQKTEWKDPLGLEVVPELMGPWLKALGPWLEVVAGGAV
ncbi:uncharacterized protein SPPG_02685 [Spizellomyces punctatus DAOM BR117]|uniref:PX domain-containing protein n=1 Tax=Spizellomyces punctatus (strain DAOM BR117) TaxID=645134 RepID=A0A0L0HMB1_SPIPD|nr:uncharacterized protein SPPG_02685 [Spizellomyces punctatus DAOM BR117]KND02198.1 hypothetical protein SPPG_02685 [Spizellomyces punctatus DAOM BR117]|eukprot:XP_016610237.1 hypothetical protein SPPG_02685 [Spizellomyces punctatus DAOM BR117]